MRSIAALPILGLLLMPLQANAACNFLPPVGGGDPIVKKKVERPKGLIGKAIGRTNWNTDFVVDQPYRSFKLFFTAIPATPAAIPFRPSSNSATAATPRWPINNCSRPWAPAECSAPSSRCRARASAR